MSAMAEGHEENRRLRRSKRNRDGAQGEVEDDSVEKKHIGCLL